MSDSVVTLQIANTALGIANATIGRMYPIAGVVLSEAAVVTQSGVSSIGIANGRNVVETAIPGISVNGNIIAQTARIELMIVALARAATIGVAGAVGVGGIGIAGLTIGLTVVAGAIAISSNQTMRDIITDPDFWEAVGDGRVEDYLHDRTGLDMSDMARALWEAMWNGDIADFRPRQSSATNDNWQQATTPPRRDPLAIDLDADGIETLGIPTGATPILFDHDADGVKTGTGWLKPDDAWLVLDRDGNGTIDSGRELFGVDTMITVPVQNPDGSWGTVTRAARTGFEALSVLDTGDGTVGSAGYGDGVFDANDAAFAQVKLWQDINQDGTSQAGELFTLADKGIASISLNASTTTTNLGNGNTVTGQATVTRTNGSVTQIDSVDLTASNLNLADNPFYREFTDTIALTEAARGLPDMGGSGWLRDMREAMSLGTAQATQFEQAISGFAQATTRDAQREQLDDLIAAWAGTSGRVDGGALRPVQGTVIADNGVTRTVRYTPMDPANYPNPATTLVPCAAFRLPAEYYEWTVQAGVSVQVLNAAGQEVLRRLGDLEAFNGARFINFTVTEPVSGSGQTQTTGYQTRWQISLAAEQIASLNAAYEALSESVYSSLVVQTRLRPYLDAVALVIDETGVRFDAAPLAAKLDANKATDERNALIDLVELNRYASPTLQAVAFDGAQTLRTWVEGLAANSPLRAELTALDVFFGASSTGSTRPDIFLGDAGNNSFSAGAGHDVLDGGAGNDTLYGGDGNDLLNGGAGGDNLSGDAGDDILDGGAGNDNLSGGAGSDRYVVSRDWGQDTINNYDTSTGKTDVIEFAADVAVTDIKATRSGDNLILSLVGGTDTLTVSAYFNADAAGPYKVEQIRFANGTSWDVAAVKALVQAGSSGADTLYGYAVADTLNGLEGNDWLYGRAGDDTLGGGAGADYVFGEDGNDALDGGADNDNLYGGNGNDAINGGVGNDNLYGDAGDDTLDGGVGNDNLSGGAGSDRYLVSRGWGQDTINNYDTSTGKTDVIEFAADVAVADIKATRSGDNLILSLVGGTDTLTVSAYFNTDAAGPYKVEQIRFANGTTWDVATVKTLVQLSGSGADMLYGYAGADTLDGQAGNDWLYGRAGDDALNGGAGADYVYGEDGNDTLDGGVDNDNMYGGTGNDVLNGGAGNDNLYGDADDDTLDGGGGSDNLNGGAGSDVYRFGVGYGVDTVVDSDPTAGVKDAVRFLGTLKQADVQFKQVGGNLEVSINGTADKVVVQSWYAGSQYRIEEFRFSDGTVLDSQVQSLVEAMAVFAPASTSTQTVEERKLQNHMLAGNVVFHPQ